VALRDGKRNRTRCACTAKTQDLRVTVAESLAKTGFLRGTPDASTSHGSVAHRP